MISNKIIALLIMCLMVLGKTAFCAEAMFQTAAEEHQSVLCQLDSKNGSAGHITFNFNPTSSIPGIIEYNGLFLNIGKKYYAIVRRITLTKVQYVDFDGGAYIFEGTDESIGNGKVSGRFKNVDDFEVSGFFSKAYSDTECIFYRFLPFKSDWAKKIAEKNPNFQF